MVSAKAAGPSHMLPHLVFASITIVGSWLLLPTLFRLTYASAYYRVEPEKGLAFPGKAKASSPITPISQNAR